MRPTFCLLICLLAAAASARYVDEDTSSLGEYGVGGFEDYTENDLENMFEAVQKRGSRIYVYRRGCVRRGGNCDHRPADCCSNSACRCNLWGANCRCQRKGLLQKWGK